VLDAPLQDLSSTSEPVTELSGQSNNDWIDEILANESRFGYRHCREAYECPNYILALDPDYVAELLGLIPVQTPFGTTLVLMAKPGKGSDEENKGPGGGGGGGRRLGDLIDDIFKDPSRLKGKTLEEVKAEIGNTPGWEVGTMRRSARAEGWALRELTVDGKNYTGRLIQYHPGTPRHFGGRPYWKVSSGQFRPVRIPAGP
jgi:hypothetical protein